MRTKVKLMSGFRPDTGGGGFSLVEILVGVGIFLTILVGVINLHTQVNLPQQGMIRDYSLVMGVCKRFLNGLIEDILKGNPPRESPGGIEEDVTEAVLESEGSSQEFQKFFVGNAGKDATELTLNFKTLLLIKDVGKNLGTDVGSPAGQFYLLQIRCLWGKELQHSYRLKTMAKRR